MRPRSGPGIDDCLAGRESRRGSPGETSPPNAPAQGHARKRRLFHALTLSLARHAPLVLSAREVARAYEAKDRLGRVCAVFTFVSHLADTPLDNTGQDGMGVLVRAVGPEGAAAVVLAAMLQALGEHAQVDYTREIVFVRVELARGDMRDLPPYAVVTPIAGRLYLALAPRHARSPLGFLPRSEREALARRRMRRGLDFSRWWSEIAVAPEGARTLRTLRTGLSSR